MKFKIVLSVFIIFLGCQNLFCQELSKQEYLLANRIMSFDSSFNSNAKVLFAGEIHRKNGNEELEIDIMRSFFSDSLTHVFVIEANVAVEKLIGRYMRSGDKSCLDSIADYYENDSEAYFYAKLRELYLRDFENGKFIIKGVDILGNRYDMIYGLSKYVKVDQELPKEFIGLKKLMSLSNKKFFTSSKARKALKKIVTESNQNIDLYKKGVSDFDEFINQVNGGLVMLEGQSIKTSEEMEVREEYMYENFKKLVDRFPDAKFFGQFGRAHVPIVYQPNWVHLKNWKSLAARLNTNENSPVKGKVCSLVYYYGANIEYSNSAIYESIIKTEDIPLFLKHSTTPFTMFKLDGENTPFKDMAEKFQYIVINKY